MVMNLHDRVQAAAAAARRALELEHVDRETAPIEVAVVLGSGLGPITARLAEARKVAYGDLPGYPGTTVIGHAGCLMAGRMGGRRTLLLCGRVHGYEGHPPTDVAFGVRVAAALGARVLVVTNASGGIDPGFAAGEIVAISDHINLTGLSPLTGPNDDRLGPRFVDMTDAYSPRLRAVASRGALALLGRPLREAVYAGMPGPSYETPAEIRMLRAAGAGLVGMSTVHEVVAARHAGIEVLGLALVANPAAGLGDGPLSHDDVTRAAAAGADTMGRLIEVVLRELPGAAA